MVIAVNSEGDWPGKKCTKDRDCNDLVTRLVCEDSICTCPTRERFHYGTVNKCLIPAQTRCFSDTRESEITPNSQCVNIVSYRVVCKTDFPQTQFNTCARTIDEVCTKATDCDQDLFLQCNENSKCGCPEGSEFIEGICQLKRRAECQIKDVLVPGPPVMNCPSEFPCGLSVPEDPESIKVCTCKEGLVENSLGECVVSYGGVCSATEGASCNAEGFLECDAESKCSCANKQDTWYDGKNCVLLEGAGCSNAPGSQQCSSFEQCVDGGDGNSACKCDAGLEATVDRKCATPYGGECGSDKAPCVQGGFQACNSDKLCGCQDPANMEFDAQTKTCFLNVGAPCTADPGKPKCKAPSECKPLGENPAELTCQLAQDPEE